MHRINECHAVLLPENGKETVKLIRQGYIVYKFTIKNGTAIQRYIKQYGEITMQQKLQTIMLYVIKMDEQGPVKVQLSTSLFQAIIDIYPWQLSSKIYFKHPDNDIEYAAGKQQYVITIHDKNATDPAHPEQNYGEDQTLVQEPITPDLNQEFLVNDGHSDLKGHFQSVNKPNDVSQEQLNRKYTELQGKIIGSDDAGLQKDCIIEEGAVKKDDARDSLNAKNLHVSKLSTKNSKKPEGFFTRLFGFLLKSHQRHLPENAPPNSE